MRALLFALLSFFLILSTAEAKVQLSPRWAIEKNALETSTGSADRLYAIAVLCPLGDAMRVRTEVGGYITKQSDRRSAAFVSVSWGYRVHVLTGLELSAYVGPALVSATDAHQSSRGQIKHDLSVGWTDSGGWGIRADYSHFSNGSLGAGPNLGRDFLGMGFLIPL
jgi:hypothetical protein